ncbi:MAG TPA: carboxypeptidase regulatory-like domain-containing protein [Kofleriaceae bacterium]|nr:carboxypeptidase regulatory-like domain-containing protein [Kofleriaceae bacterium]
MRTSLLGFVLTSLAAACGSDHSAAPDAPPPDIDAPAQPDASSLQQVTFSYTPSWSGVTTVEVWGGFGQSTDWTAPYLTLDGSSGVFTGTAMLPAGTYLYVFHVVGDDDAGSAKGPTFSRYAVDPSQTGWMACPSQSPTYSAKDMNPCSQLTVPQTAPTLYHVTGKVVKSGAAAKGYLVVLERMETGSHHYFVDRSTTGADGTYDMEVAAGTYRVQVQHPQYETKNDSQLDPETLGILRRNLTSGFAVAADFAVSDSEMAFADYAKFAPSPTATPPPTTTDPTTFTFTTTSCKFDLYGTGNEIGDPIFAGSAVTTGTSSYDGSLIGGGTVVTGSRYMWGVEEPHAKDASGIAWTAQSMVFPITWN